MSPTWRQCSAISSYFSTDSTDPRWSPPSTVLSLIRASPSRSSVSAKRRITRVLRSTTGSSKSAPPLGSPWNSPSLSTSPDSRSSSRATKLQAPGEHCVAADRHDHLSLHRPRDLAPVGEHPEAMRIALGRHDAIVRAAIESRDGYVFSTGGGLFRSDVWAGQRGLFDGHGAP